MKKTNELRNIIEKLEKRHTGLRVLKAFGLFAYSLKSACFGLSSVLSCSPVFRLFSVLCEIIKEVDRQREHNRRVLLRTDRVQRLQVSQLDGGWRLCNDLEVEGRFLVQVGLLRLSEDKR